MGITGLLPFLKSIQYPVNMKDFDGKTFAIDGYCWLHKGAFSCAMDLCLGKPTNKHIDYCMERLRFLKSCGIIPYVVLDGGHLPMKSGEEKDRKRRREENMNMGKKYYAEKNYKKAMECFQISVDITGDIAMQFIRRLRKDKVKYIVAPYEADAQLAYLEKEGLVDGIITEDSDLIVFGCKNIYYKLQNNGDAIEILLDKLGSVSNADMRGWSLKQLRQMCILAGCDYLPNLPGIGLKTAHKLILKYKTAERVIRMIALENKKEIPGDYLKRFLMAELTFVHQRVFDPRTGQLVHLNPIDKEALKEQFESLDFLGPDIEESLMLKLMTGEADPNTREILADFEEEEARAHETKYRPYMVSTDENCIISFNKTVSKSNARPVLKESVTMKTTTTTKRKISPFFQNLIVGKKKVKPSIKVIGNTIVSSSAPTSQVITIDNDDSGETTKSQPVSTSNNPLPERFKQFLIKLNK